MAYDRTAAYMINRNCTTIADMAPASNSNSGREQPVRVETAAADPTKGKQMSPASQTDAAPPSLAAIKARQQKTWASGDFSVIGGTLQIVGETLCEALELVAGERVLDVAAGSGNVAIAAARRWCDVTATDYVPELLQRARQRADAEHLPMTIEVADAEALPYATGAFDVVTSTFGVMFAPDQRRAASELLRVVRRGGRIGMANWTPQGFIGRLFKVIGRHVAPPAGLSSPARWGDEAQIKEWFGRDATEIRATPVNFMFRYRDADHWLEVFRGTYGPTLKAFEALDAAGKAALESDIRALLAEFDIGKGRGLVVPSEYLEVIIVKR
jgi:ubiquinone/menaquinone biosynthesis C-methylase UbiE